MLIRQFRFLSPVPVPNHVEKVKGPRFYTTYDNKYGIPLAPLLFTAQVSGPFGEAGSDRLSKSR